MKCDTCKYLGETFNRIRGQNGKMLGHLRILAGVDDWRYCTYPLPFHVNQRAVPMGVEHNCRVYVCKHVNRKTL
jgi:hypothetical protein